VKASLFFNSATNKEVSQENCPAKIKEGGKAVGNRKKGSEEPQGKTFSTPWGSSLRAKKKKRCLSFSLPPLRPISARNEKG
jgi:hypothetical protein